VLWLPFRLGGSWWWVYYCEGDRAAYLFSCLEKRMHAERATSLYTTRNMRSSLTMMKYLARTSSEGELNKVLEHHALCEGSLAERRRRVGQLRNEQEQLELQMSTQLQSLTTTLQADAHAKALAKARTAAHAKQMNAAAEQAARVMGAVAPHRAAARDAALAVVAPKDSWAPSSSSHESIHTQSMIHDVSAHYSVLLAEHSACLGVPPGRYCLCTAQTTAQTTGASYLAYTSAGGVTKLHRCRASHFIVPTCSPSFCRTHPASALNPPCTRPAPAPRPKPDLASDLT